MAASKPASLQLFVHARTARKTKRRVHTNTVCASRWATLRPGGAGGGRSYVNFGPSGRPAACYASPAEHQQDRSATSPAQSIIRETEGPAAGVKCRQQNMRAAQHSIAGLGLGLGLGLGVGSGVGESTRAAQLSIAGLHDCDVM